LESGCSQTTFYPLMASPSVERKLAETVGKVDYGREQRFYDIIWRGLVDAGFGFSSAWTFNRDASDNAMVDEYVVTAEEYPAVGSGGITYLGNTIYINTFFIGQYNADIESGSQSLMGKVVLSRRNQMRYRFMMQLFGMRLDKRQFAADFGVSVERGLPVEMAFMRANHAFETDNADELTLSAEGRYLMVVMMRQFFIAVNTLRDQARAALPPDERKLLFGDGR
ncbi:MAG: coproporphyrinogen dehydrogenase, partial [Eggerthellaceae bacterium]|nr:coproporphyrinogen dehydrogenase [Eggerthellaceae bacterium]